MMYKMNKLHQLMLLLAAGIFACGCQTAPRTEARRDSLDANVQSALASMKANDPSLDKFLRDSYGYVVFPSVGKGGLIVGGAYGRGQVYDHGHMIGYADITQATIGGQIGGQDFAEVIVFQDKASLDRFVGNRYEVAASASAVALKSGAAATANYTNGVAIFTETNGGLMAEAVIGGQQFRFVSTDYAGEAHQASYRTE